MAVQCLDKYTNLLIVCNKKQEAASLFDALTNSDIRTFHLSAGMCMAHRQETLSALTQALSNHEPLICVSTQLIEAGVDISFDAAIRILAGLDNAVQTGGRINRHGESPEPQPLFLCRLKGENLAHLPDIRIAQNVLTELLVKYRTKPEQFDNDLASDAAIRAYYTNLYNDITKEQGQSAQDYPIKQFRLFDLLSVNTKLKGDPARYYLNQAFRTAGEWFEVFDQANESVLIPYQAGKEIIAQLTNAHPQYDFTLIDHLLAQAKPYTVSLPTEQIQRMIKKGMIYTLLDGNLYVLTEQYYDHHIGIKEGNDSCNTLIL